MTNRASFGDRLPAPGEKTHQRKPSEDFILGTNINLNTIQSSVAKMTIRSASPGANTDPPINGSEVIVKATNMCQDVGEVSVEVVDSVLPPGEVSGDASGVATCATPERSRSHSSCSAQSLGSNTGPRSGSASPSRHGAFSNLPQSLADIQDPSTFRLEATPPSKRKINKSSFMNPSSGLTSRPDDTNDPLSSLDPMWTIRHEKS